MSARRKHRGRGRRQPSREFTQSQACELRLLLSATLADLEVASLDGTGNNLQNPDWGSVGSLLLRLSNALAAQADLRENDRYLTDLVWIWGQFIDHDLDLTAGGTLGEQANIAVPTGDPYFDPAGTGTQIIPFSRSGFDTGTGDSPDNPRQQINEITAFLDGSMIYGADEVRGNALRAFEGGKLKTSDGDLLPFNEAGLPNAGGAGDGLFLAGDIRANENIALTAMHTVWVREHNRLAEEIAADNPGLDDEAIYQQARALVRAELQVITYQEFLPALLGHGAVQAYQGYDASVNPGIANVFATAAYRLGHSLLSPELLRLNADGSVADEGNIALRNAFFNPGELVAHGIDSILQGAAAQQAQELDNQIVDDVRNFLFGPPGSGGFDLASLNIQRGRDHGLADYNQVREDFGLARVTHFEQISSDPAVVEALKSVYASVDDIDAWVGALAEDHVPGASVGELMRTIIADQFMRLRDGDRFYYENILEGDLLRKVQQTTLADVIERNTNVAIQQKNAFYDSSVMYFAIPREAGTAAVNVRVRKGHVEIVDRNNGKILVRRPVADVEQVILVGRDKAIDNILIEGSVTRQALPGGVVAWGGFGGKDALVVEGTKQADLIQIRYEQIDLNGGSILGQNFEKTQVRGLGGSDFISAGNSKLATHLTILGGAGDDILVGSAGNDVIDGQAGNDKLWGEAGNDRLYGGKGHDMLFAGPGRDQLFGQVGDDMLFGDSRQDLLDGGRGRNLFIRLLNSLFPGAPEQASGHPGPDHPMKKEEPKAPLLVGGQQHETSGTMKQQPLQDFLNNSLGKT